MSETAPAPKEASHYVQQLYDAIRTNESITDRDHSPGIIDDSEKAYEMAHEARPEIDEVLGIVARRSHDLSLDGKVIDEHAALPDFGDVLLVTKPYQVKLYDGKGQVTDQTTERVDTYKYSDLLLMIQSANTAADLEGRRYDVQGPYRAHQHHP